MHNATNATNATVIIDHFMYRISLKNTVYFNFGRETDEKLFEGLFLILFGWFGYKWPLKTGGRRYKEAVGT